MGPCMATTANSERHGTQWLCKILTERTQRRVSVSQLCHRLYKALTSHSLVSSAMRPWVVPKETAEVARR